VPATGQTCLKGSIGLGRSGAALAGIAKGPAFPNLGRVRMGDASFARNQVGSRSDLSATMKQSEIYRQNPENCADLAEDAANELTRQQYKRMEAAWRALADEQDWLDGAPPPACKGEG
jgi:hypothetical protein